VHVDQRIGERQVGQSNRPGRCDRIWQMRSEHTQCGCGGRRGRALRRAGWAPVR